MVCIYLGVKKLLLEKQGYLKEQCVEASQT